MESSSGPWQDIAIDVLGPLPSGENLLVVVDYYSRFFKVVAVHSTTSQKMIEALGFFLLINKYTKMPKPEAYMA